MTLKKNQSVAVIGGGPAGLFAAVAAAEAGAAVTLFEKLALPGRKLLATGGGKCNFTNALSAVEMAEAFGRNGRFVLPSFDRFHGEKLLAWFRERGVPAAAEDGFHFYPASRRAQDVLQALLREAERRRVAFRTGDAVTEILTENNAVSGLKTSGGTTHPARAVVLASGGRGYPVLGGGSSGYRLAERAGHRVKTPVPGMTGLHIKESWVRDCAGISLPDARVRIAVKKETAKGGGELLFTREGISAFAVLDLAGRISELLSSMPEVPLELNFLPERSCGDWRKFFAEKRKTDGTKKTAGLLSEFFPKHLAEILAGSENVPVSQLTRAGELQILERLSAMRLTATGTDGWDRAMVTRGGVILKEVDSRTLESKILPGLKSDRSHVVL